VLGHMGELATVYRDLRTRSCPPVVELCLLPRAAAGCTRAAGHEHVALNTANVQPQWRSHCDVLTRMHVLGMVQNDIRTVWCPVYRLIIVGWTAGENNSLLVHIPNNCAIQRAIWRVHIVLVTCLVCVGADGVHRGPRGRRSRTLRQADVLRPSGPAWKRKQQRPGYVLPALSWHAAQSRVRLQPEPAGAVRAAERTRSTMNVKCASRDSLVITRTSNFLKSVYDADGCASSASPPKPYCTPPLLHTPQPVSDFSFCAI
jgi:hypothetical protein